MVYTLELAFGLSGLALYLAIWYYNTRVVLHFRENAKVASTRMFLEGNTGPAFKVFSIGMIVYGTALLIGVLTLSADPTIYRVISKVGALLLLGTWLYFMHVMAQATTLPKE